LNSIAPFGGTCRKAHRDEIADAIEGEPAGLTMRMHAQFTERIPPNLSSSQRLRAAGP
jgi:hypothetical protein